MSHAARRASTATRRPTWAIPVAAVTVALVLATAQAVFAADGSDVAAQLAKTSDLVSHVGGSISSGGSYGGRDNASAVPFLGGAPGSLLGGVFEALGPLTGFDGFAPADDDKVKVVKDKVDAVDSALGAGTLTATYLCGAAACDPDANKVKDLSSIEVVLAAGSSTSGDIAFTSLNLPSIGFIPKNAQKLRVELSWSINVKLVADSNGLHMAPVAGAHTLDLGVSISLPTDAFTVNLGALKVQATTTTRPGFNGHLFVDIDGNGNLDFTFGPDTGFDALWHLQTKDSPLMGVQGDLHIKWALGGKASVDPAGLSVKVEHVTIDTSRFVGDGIQSAVADIGRVIHPIRTATSPMMEPIPGLSDFSSSLGGGDVTMLRLMGLAKGASGDNPFPENQLQTSLERIQKLDDVVAALAGGGDVDLGSFTIVGSDALTPANQAFGQGIVDELKKTLANIDDKCGPCKDKLDDLLTAVNGSATPGEGGFRFDVPVMDDPASLAGMLLGRDVDLVTFDSGRLGYPRDTLDIPLARFFIFAVKLAGPIEATIDLKGGVDTRGIAEALAGGHSDEALLHGAYLQNPADGGAVVTLYSGAQIALSTDVEVIGVSIGGGPVPNVNLFVPDTAPGGKLRPGIEQDGIGCALLESDKSSADFAVNVTATFDYFLDSDTEVLAEHTFLTRKDLCDPDADKTPVAFDDGNGNVIINPAGARSIPADQPDLIKVFMVHDPVTGDPRTIVVTGNNGQRSEIPATGILNVRYDSASDPRPVVFRVVKNDDKPFEKQVFVQTGSGADDVLVDSAGFGSIVVNGGDDKVIVTAGSKLVSGGPGDDVISGGPANDLLGGDEGDDTIDGGGGVDRLSGGPGSDVLLGSPTDGNCLVGGAGGDLVISGSGADQLFGDETFFCNGTFDPTDDGPSTDGNDTIITGGGSDFVVAGNGSDSVRLHGSGAYQGANASWKAGVTVYGDGGNDTITTGFGRDTIHGGSGNDTITSDSGPREMSLRAGDVDTIHGGTGEDRIVAGDGGDIVFGDDGTDTCSASIVGQPAEADTKGGSDTVFGGQGSDTIALEAGDDHAYGNDGDDVICGHAGIDTIFGDDQPSPNPIGQGSGDDTIFGGSGGDDLHGGPANDLVFGNAGADSIAGDDDADRLVGGSSAAGTPDGGDTIAGGDGDDVVVGDDGTISSATPRVVNVHDLFSGDASAGGADTIGGDGGADRGFGGIGNDTIRGGADDDHLEGNSGDDAVYGDAGDDDIVGGTSDEALPGAISPATAADAPDSGETILSGGTGRDVIIGDNGLITRPGGTDPILGGPARSVTLLDRDRSGAALAAVSGGDSIQGDADSDRLYGEGGNDYVKGNEADDFAQGDQGDDRLEGDDGEDDLIGGSSFESAPGVGDPDGADQLAGGAGGDVLIGDNAAITRATTGSGIAFDWDSVANAWLGQAARRSITLLDKATLNGGRFGDDVLSGGAGPDVMFGQDGSDRLYGGAGDDYQEGDGGADVLYGDQNAAPTGDARESGSPVLDGPSGPDGQDDQMGGGSWVRSRAGNGALTGQRDGADELHGDGNADVQLGDNGRIVRVIAGGQYLTAQPQTGKPTIVRQASPAGTPATALPARYDVGAPASSGLWGADTLSGDAGDDLQLAGDGNDVLYGGAGDDDQYGELGDDRMYGEAGEDAMVGDRGVITDRLISTPGATISVTAPPAVSFTPFEAHPLDRRVDLGDDGDGGPLQAPGLTTGGNDVMRGGADHDALHGAAGNDLMNGDSGGDYLFGDDGVDVLWGGKGRECADPADLPCNSDRGTNDTYVDYLFGGFGLKTDPVTGGADLLDFRPRPGTDPAAWFEITSTRPGDALADHQHHQGIDWLYGGWDRDVLQADIADNGPNGGDRLIDWTGAYNLYDHCPSAYGGFNDVRALSPSLQSFLQQLAYALGAGKSLADVQTKSTSGYAELALVYSTDVKDNAGSAYPGTPGHFDSFSCAP